MPANNNNQNRYTKTGLDAPICLLNHNEQHARYSHRLFFGNFVFETKDHLFVSPLPYLRENKIKFLKKKKNKDQQFSIL